ncbi:MAG: hypothetical protein NZM25_04590 [Leptospiraceae bacterium]|nr:hypothetical protein [Leptospiraceae bacterium]MDW8305709.1 hypothetical protein [Leptospiraceae bacterium]
MRKLSYWQRLGLIFFALIPNLNTEAHDRFLGFLVFEKIPKSLNKSQKRELALLTASLSPTDNLQLIVEIRHPPKALAASLKLAHALSQELRQQGFALDQLVFYHSFSHKKWWQANFIEKTHEIPKPKENVLLWVAGLSFLTGGGVVALAFMLFRRK